MKTNLKLITIVVLSLLLGCSAGNKTNPGHGSDPAVAIGNGRYLKMVADLTDAESLTSTVPNDGKEERKFVKLTKTNKFEEVLSGKHQLFSFKLTPTHIIAHVNIWEDDKNTHCSLIAIPKVKGTTKVLCLNRDLVSCSYPEDKPDASGFDVRGTEVFFTYHKPEGRSFACGAYSAKGDDSSAVSELRHWDGSSEKVDTLFHTDPETTKGSQMFVKDVFTSKTNRNICIDLTNSTPDKIFCRKEGTEIWEPIKGMSTSRGYPFVVQNNSLLSDAFANQMKLDLHTLKSTRRKGDLPKVIDFETANGGLIGRDEWRVIYIDPNGDSTFGLDLEMAIKSPIRTGNYAWYLNGASLRRMSLVDGQLDPKDFFDNTKLLRLSSISWSLGDFLWIHGTGKTGIPEKSILNGDGDLVYVETPTLAVEHPIDLKWDR